jgi:hypothetical protein
LIAAVNAEWAMARFIAQFVQILISFFFISVAVEQIGIARGTIVAAFSILFGGMILALAIAFGLGGRDLAREYLERRLRRSETEQERQPFEHV